MQNDSLGDRMKALEGQPLGSRFMPLLPVVARLDGKAFHTFCKGLGKPYDNRLSLLMRETTKFLVEESDALIGYTQSDEITLVWHSLDPDSQIFMDGKPAKMISILASMATAVFNKNLPSHLPDKADKTAFFDCRVFTVPNRVEAANCVLWRVQDAVRNSIQMAGQANFSHKALHGKSCNEIQKMLHQEKSLNWNDYPSWAKEGAFIQRHKVLRVFTYDEIEKLPPKHEARLNPSLVIERSDVRELAMPPFGRVTNRVEVIFEGAEPEIRKE